MTPVVLIAVIAVAVLAVPVLVLLLDGLIRKRDVVEHAFAGIDTRLEKRHDLFPIAG
ncbi:MAG: hypothetical protein HYV63_04925 [Candidatus Schekmanbacteria bacterium]|nr:hypothetical protein [Candidatus Schekmanbacteria bacterium]